MKRTGEENTHKLISDKTPKSDSRRFCVCVWVRSLLLAEEQKQREKERTYTGGVCECTSSENEKFRPRISFASLFASLAEKNLFNSMAVRRIKDSSATETFTFLLFWLHAHFIYFTLLLITCIGLSWPSRPAVPGHQALECSLSERESLYQPVYYHSITIILIIALTTIF